MHSILSNLPNSNIDFKEFGSCVGESERRVIGERDSNSELEASVGVTAREARDWSSWGVEAATEFPRDKNLFFTTAFGLV